MVTSTDSGNERERAMAAAIAATAEARSLDDLAEGGSASLRQALAARLVAITEFDDHGRPHGQAGDLGECEPEIYFPRFADVDPITRGIERHNHQIMLTSRHLDTSAFARSEVYNEYYRPREIDRVMCARLMTPSYYRRDGAGHLQPTPGLVLVAFFRARSQPDFTLADARCLRRAIPAIEALARRGRRVAADRRALAALSTLVERSDPRPRLALDASGRPLWISDGAATLLAGFVGGRRALPDVLVDAARRLAENPAGDGVRFTVDLSALTAPAVRAALSLERCATGEVFVMAHLERFDNSGTEATRQESPLVARHGLSRAETAVLELLGLGLSNDEISRRLFVSVPTVKTHVHRVLAKLGVSSRLQAALLITRS